MVMPRIDGDKLDDPRYVPQLRGLIEEGIGGFILLALFSGASLWAQEAQKPLTLEESIKIAVDRNLQLHSAVEGVMGSQFRQK